MRDQAAYRLLYGQGNLVLVQHGDDGHVYRYSFDGVDAVLSYVRVDADPGEWPKGWIDFGAMSFGTIQGLRAWYNQARLQEAQ
jgi:hypothetical protein